MDQSGQSYPAKTRAITMHPLARQLIYALCYWGAVTMPLGAQPASQAGDELWAEGNGFLSSGKLDAALWAYRQAAKAGNLNGTFAAGKVLLRQGQASLGRERVLKLSEGLGYVFCAATNRYPQACAELANVLRNGIGVQTNLICAYAWLEVAAQQTPTFRKDLDQLVVQMEPGDVLQAQNIAREYLSGRWPVPVARPVDQGDPRLQIRGMTVGPHGPLIILNGETLGVGDTVNISPRKDANQTGSNPIGSDNLVVSCYAIGADYALVAVTGEPNLKLLALNNK